MVWAVMEGGREGGSERGMGPEEAWEVYEDWCRREREEGREGGREGGRGGREGERVVRARRREGGRRGWQEWAVQIAPCCLLLPCCR